MNHVYGVLRAMYRTSSFHKAFSQGSRPMNWAKDAINLVPTKYPYSFVKHDHHVLVPNGDIGIDGTIFHALVLGRWGTRTR